MSGKKAQRTKGNTQASSSSRSAKFLQHEGQAGLISFSGLAGNVSGIASQEIGDVNALDTELRLLLRKMSKKDTITKLKAVQEFTLLCKQKDGDMIKNMLNFWPRMYNKLSHDFDHRVRESTQQAHYQLTKKAGRNLAPHLKQIIVNWLMSQFDNHVSAATNAKMSFDELFPEKKRKEVLLFCKTEILQACEKNILRETADTLSDPKVVSLEEREAKYNRFISSTFLLLKYLLENLHTNDDDVIKDNLTILFADKKFWKFSKHDSPMIRSSFFILLLSFCEQLTSLMEKSLEHISVTVLTNIDEQDPIVTKALWDVILYCLSTFKNLWQFVNVRKAVWPKLWKLLNAGCYGNINIVYPNLLPFLSNISPELAGEGTGFYAEFFSHIADILTLKQKVLCEDDIKLVISTYMECIRCLLVKNLNNKELCDFIIWNLIADSLHNIFHTAKEYHVWYGGVFIKELHLLLSYIHQEFIKNDENSEYYRTLYTDLWKIISVVVFIKSDNDIKFKFSESESDIEFKTSQSNFYKSLMSFLSFCSENLSVRNIPGSEIYNNIGHENDELYFVFIRNVLKCYIIETFGKKQFAVGNELIKLVSLSFNIDLIRFVCIEKLQWENHSHVFDEISNVDVCNTFVNSIVLPLLAADIDYQKEVVEVTIGLVTALHEKDKQDYLISIFERELFSGSTLLALFVEVFRYSKEEYVVQWLKSSFVEKEIMKLCTFEKDDDHADTVDLKWQILRMYIQIVEDNPEKLSLYHNKLLVLIKYCIESGDQSSGTVDEAVLSTFASLCTPSFEISKAFQETLFVIFRHNVSQAETTSSVDSMNKGFDMLMQKQQDIVHFKEIVNKMIVFAKDCGINQINCSKLCTAMCSLTQLAQMHSNEISYGKIMLDEIFGGDQESINYQDVGNSNMSKFYSEFLKVLSAADCSILQTCCEKKLNNIILKCISVGEKDDKVTTDIKECIKSCEFIHFSLVDDAIHRCLQGSLETDFAKNLLQTLLENDQLSESILDHILMLSAPSKHNYMNFACATYCMIVSIVNDISCIRALVEMYVDELKNNGDVINSNTVFGQFIKVLSGVISRWYKILNTLESDLEDYYDIVYIVLKNMLIWKDDHSGMVLFSCSLAETDPSTILLNIHLIQLLCQCAQTALEVFKADHWDFLLCSMISWLQSCEESLHCFEVQSLYPQFMHTSFQLFNMVACVFDSCPAEASTCNILPCIYLKDTSPVSVPPLNDDTVTEWKELFLPTASTSLLHIYMKMMKKGHFNLEFTELEQTLCSCIRFVPPYMINEFVCSGCDGDNEQQKALEEFYSVCCQILASGTWWNKIGSYQLLTGLGESVEGKLCYISQKEDEEHEGMRSFPSSLIQTMENSRDETLKVLSSEGVSIKDPLKSFDHLNGKLELLTYLLSWQSILQLFKMADPSNRAMFANYFHNNSDVHDLITCLFCLMPQSINFENKKKIILTNFTFTEIRQVAFHLLTTAMECIPALIRNWFNNHVNRVDTGTVNRFVSNFISPLLLKNEFQNLNESSKEFNNMIVKTRAAAREIAAVYTVDEVSMELVVHLGQNHPLSPVSVTCGKRIGVSNSLWRQWMLQLNTFLSFQNGSILDGLALWKRNVDKRFEGVEECMVCFSVLHGSNYSLPTIACKTCKKKFHPACLYKWFNTSGKCTCPLCRNVF